MDNLLDESKTKAQLGELFIFTQEPHAVRIRTPFLYPDGEPIDLFLIDSGRRLSDLGRSRDYIQTHIAQDTFINQRKLLDDLEITHGIRYEGAYLYMPLIDEESLANAIIQLASACLRFVSVVIGQPQFT